MKIPAPTLRFSGSRQNISEYVISSTMEEMRMGRNLCKIILTHKIAKSEWNWNKRKNHFRSWLTLSLVSRTFCKWAEGSVWLFKRQIYSFTYSTSPLILLLFTSSFLGSSNFMLSSLTLAAHWVLSPHINHITRALSTSFRSSSTCKGGLAGGTEPRNKEGIISWRQWSGKLVTFIYLWLWEYAKLCSGFRKLSYVHITFTTGPESVSCTLKRGRSLLYVHSLWTTNDGKHLPPAAISEYDLL